MAGHEKVTTLVESLPPLVVPFIVAMVVAELVKPVITFPEGLVNKAFTSSFLQEKANTIAARPTIENLLNIAFIILFFYFIFIKKIFFYINNKRLFKRK